MSDSQMVSVSLIPLSSDFPITRHLTLSQKNPYIPIGRSSKREFKIRTPAKDNGWFDSRVMSRDHAELSLDSEKKIIYLSDHGSTHGTWLNNVKLIPEEATPLLGGDIIQFGVDVERRSEDYPALSVRCKIDWIKNDTSQIVDNPYLAQSKPVPDTEPAPELRPASSTNTFCVPEDYSDYEEAIKSEAPFEKVEESSIECSEQQQAIPLADGLFSVKQELQARTIEPKDIEVRASEPVASPKSAPQDSAEEVSEDEPEENSDPDPSSFDESELESDGESALHSVTSVKNLIVDIDADSGEDFSYQPSESDAGIHESDSESVPDDSCDDESSAHGQGKCIDPSLLTQGVNLAIPDAEKSLNDAWGIKSEMESNAKIETQDTERKESDSAASRAPRELEHKAPLQSYTTSAQFFPAHTFGSLSSTRVFYRDGPFSYNDSAQERASSAEPSSAEPILAPVSLPLKRKCSELETQDAQLPQFNVLSSQKVNLKTIHQTQEAAKAINSALDEVEPPKKRAKSRHSSSSSCSSSTGLAGYTATAVVSALLGSVGTIALLAALPADYFQ